MPTSGSMVRCECWSKAGLASESTLKPIFRHRGLTDVDDGEDNFYEMASALSIVASRESHSS